MSDLKREVVWVVTDEDGALVDVCATYAEAFADSSKNDFIQGFAPVTEKTLADVSRDPPLIAVMSDPKRTVVLGLWRELLDYYELVEHAEHKPLLEALHEAYNAGASSVVPAEPEQASKAQELRELQRKAWEDGAMTALRQALRQGPMPDLRNPYEDPTNG